MPLGIFLLWPALHVMYGLTEHRSRLMNNNRRYSGRVLLLSSLLLVGQPFGFEKGIFYWLFALMAIGLCFVQLRVWQPMIVSIVTVLSLFGFLLIGVNHVIN